MCFATWQHTPRALKPYLIGREHGRSIPFSKSSKKDYEAGRQSRRLEPPHNRFEKFEKWGVDAKGRRAFLRIMRFRVPRGSRSIRRLVYHANIDQRANVTTSFVPGYRSLWPSCSRGPSHRRIRGAILTVRDVALNCDEGWFLTFTFGNIGMKGLAGKILFRVKLIVDLSASRYE